MNKKNEKNDIDDKSFFFLLIKKYPIVGYLLLNPILLTFKFNTEHNLFIKIKDNF